MKHIAYALLAAILFITGCATTKLTPAQEAAADYGEYPTNYEEIVKEYFNSSLVDPYSAHYRIGTPQKGFSAKRPILGGGVDKFGYIVDVAINAKNRFGGYVGERPYRVLIRNGQVVWKMPMPY